MPHAYTLALDPAYGRAVRFLSHHTGDKMEQEEHINWRQLLSLALYPAACGGTDALAGWQMWGHIPSSKKKHSTLGIYLY